MYISVISSKRLVTFGRAYHLVNNVNASNTLSDRMLHLQACVHLQEVKLTLAVNKELHRA